MIHHVRHFRHHEQVDPSILGLVRMCCCTSWSHASYIWLPKEKISDTFGAFDIQNSVALLSFQVAPLCP